MRIESVMDNSSYLLEEVLVHHPSKVTSDCYSQGVLQQLPVVVIPFNQYNGAGGVNFMAWYLCQFTALVVYLVLAARVRLP